MGASDRWALLGHFQVGAWKSREAELIKKYDPPADRGAKQGYPEDELVSRLSIVSPEEPPFPNTARTSLILEHSHFEMRLRVFIALDEWPVSFIRISSATPALAKAELKLCRIEWNVRRVNFLVPLPWTIPTSILP